MHTEIWQENVNARDHWEDRDVDGLDIVHDRDKWRAFVNMLK
jgi:hypothetical protein